VLRRTKEDIMTDDMLHGLPQDLSRPIDDIEARIRATPIQDRLELQADLHRLCLRLEREGYEVPERLRNLDQILTDAATEAQFDNMPV
jgi:hypothetical protein